MKAEELIGDKLDAVLEDENTVAEKKWDGHRGNLQVTKLANRIFSRNISKETGWFSENSDQMPHIRDTVRVELAGTVLDGEVTLPIENCSCRDVQSVTGALPETALKNQIERGFAELNAFDILYYKGLNVQHFPYWKRKIYLWKAIKEFNVPFIKMCHIYVLPRMKERLTELWLEYDRKATLTGLLNYLVEVESYDKLFKDMLAKGDEGIILKNMNCKYQQKTSKDFVKMKGHNVYDCIIMGYEEPTREFDGKTNLKDWKYWESYEHDIFTDGIPESYPEDECAPVTKFYALGWVGALYIGVWVERHLQYFIDTYGEGYEKQLAKRIKDGFVREGDKHHWELFKVGRCSGLDDETRQEISEHRKQYLGAVIEVEAQKIINGKTGSLQHPRFKDWRPDKNSEECTFNAHVRKYDEEDN